MTAMAREVQFQRHDRTRAAVTRQLKGMGCGLYEVGIRHAKRGMLNREWNAADIVKALAWLKRSNLEGCDIYIRPARSKPSRLVLIDDLGMGTLARLQDGPYSAAVTVQTSPNNYQAWVKSDNDMPPGVRREVARYLAREYGGDLNSADSAHYGRLAGFTNRKPEHIDAAGRSPFVLLDSYNGRSASGVAELARAYCMAANAYCEVRSIPREVRTPQTTQKLSKWYLSLWSSLEMQFRENFDASRADWMAAVAMFRKGYDFHAVTEAIAQHSPGLARRKGGNVADYAARTASKAEIWHGLKAQGTDYAEVADSLLPLAQERANGRS